MKRFAEVVFNVVLTLALLAMVFLFWFGIESKAETMTEERIATALVEPRNDIREPEGPDVVVVECVVVEVPAVEPVELYDVPLDWDLQAFIIGKAEEIGIDPAVIFAMARKESTYDHSAIGDNGASYGLLQIQPRWNMARMERLGCLDLLDPYQNVTVAADLLGELMVKHGDLAVALTVYNHGHYPGYVTEYAQTVLRYAAEVAKHEST